MGDKSCALLQCGFLMSGAFDGSFSQVNCSSWPVLGHTMAVSGIICDLAAVGEITNANFHSRHDFKHHPLMLFAHADRSKI